MYVGGVAGGRSMWWFDAEKHKVVHTSDGKFRT